MKESIIARRYAKGLAEVANSRNEIVKVREDLENLADLLDPERGEISIPELLNFLRSPTVPMPDKIKLTDVLCEKLAIGQTVSDFLNVLIAKFRVGLINLMVVEFEKLAAEYEHACSAVIESARELDEAKINEISEALKQTVGRDVRVTTKVNPGLIAGVRVRMGDTLLDGSVDNQLQRLAARLI